MGEDEGLHAFHGYKDIVVGSLEAGLGTVVRSSRLRDSGKEKLEQGRDRRHEVREELAEKDMEKQERQFDKETLQLEEARKEYGLQDSHHEFETRQVMDAREV
eukprot:TRINITY_DN784_c0_g1_i1.p3 TRINITY_DN784_c0_g1~~TRINITY_DN784_c0_g1_i1.p3  ORF type:complete len:103 (+),score=29.65 TRINITY_DN784_c0_g1_i1:98-406(+)